MSWLFIVNNKKKYSQIFWIKNIHHNLYSLIPNKVDCLVNSKKNLASQLALELIEWAVSFSDSKNTRTAGIVLFLNEWF